MIKIADVPLAGLKLVEPTVFRDGRGYFFESWRKSDYEAAGLPCNFVQDNESYSTCGVLRGLHCQAAPYSQTKLLRVVLGKIWDVVVDLRRAEPTFGKSYGVELSAENHRQLYIPKGFAHGFAVLSSNAVVNYKVDAPWNRDAERCLRFDDPALAIEWPVPASSRILSPKDLQGMSWTEFLQSQEGF